MANTDNIDYIIKFMKDNPGSTIVASLAPKGGKQFRLRDSKVNPIMNISETLFRKKLDDNTFISNEPGIWILNQ